MELQHCVFGPSDDEFLEVLKSGYLKPSSKTKNIKASGREEGSKFIFLQITNDKSLDMMCYHLSPDFLKENRFLLLRGWGGWDDIKRKELINGKELSEEEFKKELKDMKNKVDKYIKNTQHRIKDMSHEIIVSNQINLKKYLKRIIVPKNYTKTIEYLKEKYPHVKIEYLEDRKKKKYKILGYMKPIKS